MLGKVPGSMAPAKMAGGSGPGGSGDEHDIPAFGVDDFPALGGGMGNLPLQRHGSSDTLGPNMGSMHAGGMSGIAAAKLPQDFQMASEDFPALPGLHPGPGGARGHEEGIDKVEMGGM